MSVWTILFIILLIAWLGGFTVFHVAGGLIHLLLVFAVISLILHFVMGKRTAQKAKNHGAPLRDMIRRLKRGGREMNPFATFRARCFAGYCADHLFYQLG